MAKISFGENNLELREALFARPGMYNRTGLSVYSVVSLKHIMSRFHIYSREHLIGWSELEFGDPPMGVAFGKFIPAPAYASIQARVVSLTGKDQAGLVLSARLSSGEMLEAVGGVCIADYSAEAWEDGLEVSVLGISSPAYEHLFPHHVATYERQFPTTS